MQQFEAKGLRRAPLALCVGFVLASSLAPTRTTAVTTALVRASHTGSNRTPDVLAVTSCEDDGSAGTLRSAIAGAASGDTIDLTQLTCGTITLVSGEIAVAVDDLTIEGPGADTLTIDADHGADYSYIYSGRAFYHSGSGTLTIDGLTIVNGYIKGFAAAYGGCIFSNGNVALTDSLVTGCRTSGMIGGGGGGIGVVGALTIDQSTVADNEALGYAGFAGGLITGGGVHSINGPLTITNSLIDGNRTEISDVVGSQAGAGGVSCYWGLTTISYSVISNNFAGCDTSTTYCFAAVAGGVRALGGLSIVSSSITGNIAEAAARLVVGGAVETEGGAAVSISDSDISDNHAKGPASERIGGALDLASIGMEEISSSTISNNTAYQGGGIYVSDGALKLSNSTVSSNTAANGGGGIFVRSYFPDPISIENSTVTLNTSTGPIGGGGIVDQNSSGISSFQSSIIAGNIVTSGAPTYDADLGVTMGAIQGANNLIVAAIGVTLPPDTISADPMLGPLQDNGGSTLTHALLPGSPAIDTGNNAANLSWDQRGDGYPRVVGTSADIGALEYSATDDQPPTAENDTYATSQDTTLTVNAPGVLANDSDPDGDSLTAVLVSSPSNGTLALSPDGSFVYVPAAGFSGTDSFTYEANDGQLHSNVATVAIEVSRIDQPPIAADDSYTTAENTTLKVSVPGVLGNDSDPDGDPLTAVLITNPSNGTLTLNPDGSFVYVPAPSFVGTDSFTYEANDGQLNSNIATVAIKVSHVDQPPVAANDSYTTAENAALAIGAPGVLGNDSDPDGDTLTAVLVSSPSNGNLKLNADGSFVYVPAEDFSGTDTFTYEANDGQLNSNIATVTITVTQGVVDTIFADGFDGP